jgi:hypothetical protein
VQAPLCDAPLQNPSAFTIEYTILCLLFKVSLSMTLASEIKRENERECKRERNSKLSAPPEIGFYKFSSEKISSNPFLQDVNMPF